MACYTTKLSIQHSTECLQGRKQQQQKVFKTDDYRIIKWADDYPNNMVLWSKKRAENN